MEINHEQKTRFLKNYRILFTKIERLKEMSGMFPDRKKEYAAEIETANKNIALIEKSIEAIDDGLLSEILYQKYILGRSLQTISYELNYSKRQIERLHTVALERLMMRPTVNTP